MTRAVALVSGDGSKLQAILDAAYFQELPEFELVAVISTDKNSNAMKRAESFKVPSFVVDPELFPNASSYSMAVANKLRDMDINLVILAGFNRDLGVIPYQYRHGIIGTYPSLIPAFDDVEDGNIFRAAIDRGLKITGATAYFADNDGCVGDIIMQKTVEILPGDTPSILARRILDEAEKPMLQESVKLFCQGRLSFRGHIVEIAEQEPLSE